MGQGEGIFDNFIDNVGSQNKYKRLALSLGLQSTGLQKAELSWLNLPNELKTNRLSSGLHFKTSS